MVAVLTAFSRVAEPESQCIARTLPPIPWTALAVVIPNCVGFVLYFLLRKPILHPCPSCGRGVAPVPDLVTRK